MRIIYSPNYLILTASLAGTSAILVGCLGISSQDSSALVDESKLTYSAYEKSDGGAERALIRAAHCATEGVLRRNKIDAGTPDIGCAP